VAPQALSFQFRAKQLAVSLFLLSLMEVVYYDSSETLLFNILIIGSGILVGTLVALGFLRRINAARITFYVLAYLTAFGLLSFGEQSLVQKIVTAMSAAYFLYFMYTLEKQKIHVAEYFRSPPIGKGWKIFFIAIFACVYLMGISAAIFQTFMRTASNQQAEEMSDQLITEGEVNPAVMEKCIEKYSAENLSENEIQSFCKCVSLNLQHLMSQNSADMGMTDIMTKSMAIGDLCMKSIGKDKTQ
jgi:hypothetical protein